MPLVEFLELNILGSPKEMARWTFIDWCLILVWAYSLCIFFLLHTSLIVLQRKTILIINSNTYLTFINVLKMLTSYTPLVGAYLTKRVKQMNNFNINSLIPLISRTQYIIELICIWIFSNKMFENKNCTKLFIREGSSIFNLSQNGLDSIKTTLFISNHRSCVDYFIINYLLRKNVEKDFSLYDVLKAITARDNESLDVQSLIPSKLQFCTWGKLFNFPRLSNIYSFIFKDENTFINDIDLADKYKHPNNKIITIFPEVNIFNKELQIVQKKLFQDYSFIPKFNNLLYPRFLTFVNTIKAFAKLKNVQRPRESNYLLTKKLIKPSTIRKTIEKMITSEVNDNTHIYNKCLEKEDIVLESQTSLFLPKDQPIRISSNNSSIQKKSVEKQNQKQSDKHEISKSISPKSINGEETVILNDKLYDITILYFKIKYVKKGHDHNTGSFSNYQGIQLEQITPTLLEMFRADSYSSRDPFIIYVDIQERDISPLLAEKTTHLEKWLEGLWIEKDKRIEKMKKDIMMKVAK